MVGNHGEQPEKNNLFAPFQVYPVVKISHFVVNVNEIIRSQLRKMTITQIFVILVLNISKLVICC